MSESLSNARIDWQNVKKLCAAGDADGLRNALAMVGRDVDTKALGQGLCDALTSGHIKVVHAMLKLVPEEALAMVWLGARTSNDDRSKLACVLTDAECPRAIKAKCAYMLLGADHDDVVADHMRTQEPQHAAWMDILVAAGRHGRVDVVQAILGNSRVPADRLAGVATEVIRGHEEIQSNAYAQRSEKDEMARVLAGVDEIIGARAAHAFLATSTDSGLLRTLKTVMYLPIEYRLDFAVCVVGHMTIDEMMAAPGYDKRFREGRLGVMLKDRLLLLSLNDATSGVTKSSPQKRM